MSDYQPPDDGPFDMHDPTPASDDDVNLITCWIYRYLFDDGELSSLIELAIETFKQRADLSIRITPQLLARVERQLQEQVASKLNTESLWKPIPQNLISDN